MIIYAFDLHTPELHFTITKDIKVRKERKEEVRPRKEERRTEGRKVRKEERKKKIQYGKNEGRTKEVVIIATV